MWQMQRFALILQLQELGQVHSLMIKLHDLKEISPRVALFVDGVRNIVKLFLLMRLVL